MPISGSVEDTWILNSLLWQSASIYLSPQFPKFRLQVKKKEIPDNRFQLKRVLQVFIKRGSFLLVGSSTIYFLWGLLAPKTITDSYGYHLYFQSYTYVVLAFWIFNWIRISMRFFQARRIANSKAYYLGAELLSSTYSLAINLVYTGWMNNLYASAH